MKNEPVKDIPIPPKFNGKIAKKSTGFWNFEDLTEYEMSIFFPHRNGRSAHNALSGFKRKYNGLYKNRKFTVQAREEEVNGKKVKGVRVWRTDKDANTPEQEAILKGQPPKRITQSDIHRSLKNG